MARFFFVSSVNVEGSIFVMMMARSVGFGNCKVGIRFDSFEVRCETAALFMLGVYSLRNFVFLTASRHIPC